MKRILAHGLLAVIVLTSFWLCSRVLIELKKEPVKVPPTRVVPAVAVVQVKSATVPVSIQANGTVRSRTTTQLTSQVSGQIIEVGESFEEGGFFDKDDVLLRIDPVTYQTQLANAQAQLAAAQLAAATEEAAAKQAKRDWQRLKSSEPRSDLASRLPQLAKAKADVKAAEATVISAEHSLRHTEIQAPYAGRVRSKMVDIGQSVSALGVVLADIYAIDFAEVALPLPQEDAWFLDIPKDEPSSGLAVILSGDVGANMKATWQGVVDRSSGVVDTNNRFVKIIVRVEDPYNLQGKVNREPLRLGQFVSATIPGRAIEKAFAVPREAVLPGDLDLVLVIKPKASDLKDAIMERRPVTIIRKESDRVIVTEGLKEGEYVSVTRLQISADGMEVSASVANPADQKNRGKLIEQAAP